VFYQDVQAALETFDDDFGQMVEDSACLHTFYVDPSADICRYVSAVVSDKRSSVITPEVLAHQWHIGLEAAKQTMTVMPQSGLQHNRPW